jgi:23S rRNA (uridine2552-2'-O)-methyltransferase
LFVKRHRSNKRWLQQHHGDAFVQKARKEGYRSRAAYKLLEIDRRDRLLRPGSVVVELGAAPGGWSQVAAQRVGRKGCVIALDRLPMTPLAGVEVVEGDIDDAESIVKIMDILQGRPVDLVISDMAPNISGMDAIDQPRSIHLAELALDFAFKVLRPGGDILIKIFQGAGMESFRDELRRSFRKVVIRKPESSRARSREVYLLAREYRPQGGGAVG